MTHEELNELGSLISQLEAIQNTLEAVRMYVEPPRGTVNDALYTANTALAHVTKDIDTKIHTIYQNHNQED